jgi:hypothetical protein
LKPCITIRPFDENDAAQVRRLFITVNRLLSLAFRNSGSEAESLEDSI